MIGVFPSVLKTAKVVPVFKKDSKLDIATIAQSPCYRTLKKFLKNLCVRPSLKSCSFLIHRLGEEKNSHEAPTGGNFFFAISLSKKIYDEKI